jgi:signal transduction histidine kinase
MTRTHARTGWPDAPTPPRSAPAAHRGVPSGDQGRGTARLLARPGVAIAASAPVALVVLDALPGYRPAAAIPYLLCLLATAVLVMSAELATFDPGDRSADAGPRVPGGQNSWSDPAMVSIGRWLAHWPGVAGVSAMSWWAARTGAAGLLCQLAFRAIGAPLGTSAAAGVVTCLAMTALAMSSLAPRSRHLVHLALGVVAAAGLVATVSGVMALQQGRLAIRLLPSGPVWSSATAASSVAVQSAGTVVLLCLAGVCLLAVTPATSTGAGPRAKAAIRLSVGTSIICWGFAVPALARAAGLDFSKALLESSPDLVRPALAVILTPIAGSYAPTMAGWLLFATCLAGALGALSAGTGLARNALGPAKTNRAKPDGAKTVASPYRAAVKARAGSARRRKRAGALPVGVPPVGVPSTGVPSAGVPSAGVPSAGVPSTGVAVAAAAVTGLVAGAIALIGPRAWLLIALGALATAALALTTLAPPVLPQCQRVPNGVRISVAATAVLVETLALGAAGPLALALVGIGALAGAFALGWQGAGGWQGIGKSGGWTTRRLALPWGTAAAALVTTSAVTTLELTATGSGVSSPAMWRGLAVVVMGAGVVLLAVLPATSRLRVEHLGNAASVLSQRALPALTKSLDGLASGGARRSAMTELSELKAATRPLEAELAAYRAPDELLMLTMALVDASNQVVRMATGVDAVAQLDARRLEELVEERIANLSNVNRNLVDSQWRRRQLLDRTVRVAERERARIAANLHDGPIQRLAALGLVLDRCSLRLDRDDREGAMDLVKRARGELSEEIRKLREMMSELRPPILDEGGLDAALRDQLSGWSATTGVESRFDVTEHEQLPSDSETVVYRVVQEALTNVAKHARASHVTVSIGPSGTGLRVVVWDNGKGFNPRKQRDMLRDGHFGLVVMRERVELAAGRFEVKSAPLTGTQVILWVPVAAGRDPVEAA